MLVLALVLGPSLDFSEWTTFLTRRFAKDYNSQRLSEKVSWIIIIVRRKIKGVQNLGHVWGRTSRAQRWRGKWAYE